MIAAGLQLHGPRGRVAIRSAAAPAHRILRMLMQRRDVALDGSVHRFEGFEIDVCLAKRTACGLQAVAEGLIERMRAALEQGRSRSDTAALKFSMPKK